MLHAKGQLRLSFLRGAPAVRLAYPSIPLHPQGMGEGIPPHGFAVPLRSGLRPSEIKLIVLSLWYEKEEGTEKVEDN